MNQTMENNFKVGDEFFYGEVKGKILENKDKDGHYWVRLQTSPMAIYLGEEDMILIEKEKLTFWQKIVKYFL